MCAERAKKNALYRFYNGMRELLYIGISEDAFQRAKQHRRGSKWTDEAAFMHVANYPSRAEAREAERLAIAIERPKYNRHHVRNMPLPDAPFGMEITDEDADLPHLTSKFEDAEADAFRLGFDTPGMVTFQTDDLSYLKLTADDLRTIADMIETADAWSEEMLASENGKARCALYET